MRIKSVDISDKELHALEDLTTVWVLCGKHNAQSVGKSEVEIFKMQN